MALFLAQCIRYSVNAQSIIAGCASDCVGVGPLRQDRVPPDADMIGPNLYPMDSVSSCDITISTRLLESLEISQQGSGSISTPMFLLSCSRILLLSSSSRTEYKPSVFVDVIFAPYNVCACPIV